MVVTKPHLVPYSASRSGSQINSQRGQSLVEFALVLLPFLMLTIGVIELGRAWSVKQGLTNAAREGARVLILPYGANRICPDIDCSSAASIQVAALDTTKTFLTNLGINPDPATTEINLIRQTILENGSITNEPLAGQIQSGDLVGISIKYHYTSVLQGFFNSDATMINMVGLSVMRHE